ncbi:myeloid differentiation primary response protein MyD88 [Colias croceus]|uniref:myeloid differentiation primary response protein MyD88 n=1 Tax=Colias crocea TaxID=72248 RepID=UPI001E27CB92|nr:myeloid differentiation primary response protein MyD88 [Colias croceus]
MNAVVDSDLRASPLTALTHESLNLLSSLLNTRKILLTVCPDQLSRHRDWRGIASLANISSEVAASIREYNDKTRRVLDLWIHSNDGTATVGRLLEILQWIDRHDVYDDLLDLASRNKLIVKQVNQNGNQELVAVSEEDLITDDDKKFGCPQRYHAYVLYAREDRDFVNELLSRLTENGFRLCTEDDLLPGHGTRFAPVSRLISERCSRIILIYSPDFLRSPANTFFMNLAQADGIEKKQLKIIPIMYRHCILPLHLTYYHNLYYSTDRKSPYEFWGKLERSLEVRDVPRLTSSSSTHSAMRIEELPNSDTNRFTPEKKQDNFLKLPSPPTDTSSMNDLRSSTDTKSSYETKSLNSSIDIKKKKSGFRKLLDSFKGKKHKKAIMLQN